MTTARLCLSGLSFDLRSAFVSETVSASLSAFGSVCGTVFDYGSASVTMSVSDCASESARQSESARKFASGKLSVSGLVSGSAKLCLSRRRFAFAMTCVFAKQLLSRMRWRSVRTM